MIDEFRCERRHGMLICVTFDMRQTARVEWEWGVGTSGCDRQCHHHPLSALEPLPNLITSARVIVLPRATKQIVARGREVGIFISLLLKIIPKGFFESCQAIDRNMDRLHPFAPSWDERWVQKKKNEWRRCVPCAKNNTKTRSWIHDAYCLFTQLRSSKVVMFWCSFKCTSRSVQFPCAVGLFG